MKGGTGTHARKSGRGSRILENKSPKDPLERLKELKSICRQAEKDGRARGAFLDEVRKWRSDRAFRAAEPGIWGEGDILIRDTLRRMLQPNLVEDVPGTGAG